MLLAMAAGRISPASTEIRGRFLVEGRPVDGVQLALIGWPASEERLIEQGDPGDWRNPQPVITGNDGVFSIRLDPPPAYQFALDAKLEGFGGVSWRWDQLSADGVHDLGDVILARSGCIEGSLVGADGAPLVGTFYVYAEGLSEPEGSAVVATSVEAMVAPGTGRFRLEDAPAGRVELSVHSELTGWFEGPTVIVRGGETTETLILYSGPGLEGRIVVTAFSEPFFRFLPEEGSVKLYRDGRLVGPARKLPGSASTYAFDNLEAGAYEARIEDPLFEPWSAAEIRPGEAVEAPLSGSSAARLTVVDEQSGEPVAGLRLVVRFHQLSGYPLVFEVGSLSRDGHQTLVDGLIPCSQTFVLSAPGYVSKEVVVEGLAASEVVDVRASLSRAGR
jgi:hypothetical protein